MSPIAYVAMGPRPGEQAALSLGYYRLSRSRAHRSDSADRLVRRPNFRLDQGEKQEPWQTLFAWRPSGLGRIGRIHAQHVHEFASEQPGICELTALVDNDRERAEDLAKEFCTDGGVDIRIFGTVKELIASECSDASFVCTPTETHRDTAGALVSAGQRVLLEKPLTDSLQEDRKFVAWLNANHPQSIMLAFSAAALTRRFSTRNSFSKPARSAARSRSSPPWRTPALRTAEYRSGGLLVDMSVHNVDEVLWMTGKRPHAAGSMGSLIYSQGFSPVKEDFDDGYIRLWFDDRMIAQIEVSRNHVSGYRVETWIFGEKGQIHIGRFEQKPLRGRRRNLRA